jgi:dipeptidase E
MVMGVIEYIPNALDFTSADPVRAKRENDDDMEELRGIGIAVELLDLKDYFGQQEQLKDKLDSLAGVWVRGGNTFVLRQAMKLSGFDELIVSMLPRKDFFYGGYSASCRVLSPSMRGYATVENPNDFPYEGIAVPIWNGFGILDFTFMPHYDSDHPESADIDREIEYCIRNKVLFKAFRDGEVYVFEK